MTALRPARLTDAGRVGAILSEFVDQTDWLPRLHSRAEDIAHADAMIARGWVTVAEREGRIVGFAATEGSDLDALYVASDAQGSGVGKALLKHLQAEHKALNLWTFQANTKAQEFYRAHGFSETARSDGSLNDEGLPDIRYLWQREAT